MNKKTILQLLNIRLDESWLVSRLFFLQFFQGMGVALFFTAANALFLKNHDVAELPKAYALGAIMLWIAGYVYSRLEHSLPLRRLIMVVIIIMAVSTGLMWIGYRANRTGMFLYFMLAWYYVLYLLSNLEFWGLSSLLFDVRQSKRLFGIISAGDIPAKFFGFMSASLIVPFTGSANMLLIGMVCMFASLIYWWQLDKGGKLAIHIDHHQAHTHTSEQPDTMMSYVNSFFGSSLIASVAVLSFLVFTCTLLFTFSFYAEIKERIHGDEQLATFIGLFYALGRVVAVFVKLLFTGKLAEALGIKGALLITPIILLTALVCVMGAYHFYHNDTVILYGFGILFIISETLKTALQDPVFIALMQPLRSSLRLKGHTIVKGIMDPFALLFSALIVMAVLHVSPGINLQLLGIVLLVLLMVWIVSVYVVNRYYLLSLVDGLQNRYISGKEIDLSHTQTLTLISEKIQTGETGEAIYLLQLISRQHIDYHHIILLGFENPNVAVKTEAIRIIEHHKLHDAIPALHRLLKTRPTGTLLASCIEAVCTLQEEEDADELSIYLDSQDPIVVKASIIGLLKNGNINAVVSAGQKLQLLITSTTPAQRIAAAEIIGALKVRAFYKTLIHLMRDSDTGVVRAAIIASAGLKSEKLCEALLEQVSTATEPRLIWEALHHNGAAAMPAIDAYIHRPLCTDATRLKLIQLTAHIGGNHATALLTDWLEAFPTMRTDIYHGLYACGYSAPIDMQPVFSQQIAEEMEFGFHLLAQQHCCDTTGADPQIKQALQLELNQVCTRLLWLFSFLYDRDNIARARNGFQLGKRESIANALELIDMTVPKEIAMKFNSLFELSPIADKVQILKSHIRNNVSILDELYTQLIFPSAYHYHSWTRAIALYHATPTFITRYQDSLQKVAASTELLIRETCLHSLRKTTIAA